MKKLFVSVGLAAAGTACVQVRNASALEMQEPKLWSTSASLRGFYDDNYTTGNSKSGSYGFEVSPQISFSIPMQQTEFGMRYTYGLYYYQAREEDGQKPIDQSHQVDLWLDHSFNERWNAKLEDTLAIGQEPELLNSGTPGNPNANPFRVNGNNIANTVTLTVHTDWTRLFSTLVTFSDSFYDYENSGATQADVFPTSPNPYITTIVNPYLPLNSPPPAGNHYNWSSPAGNGQGASLAGSLNRINNSGAIDFQWHVAPETMIFIGYKFDLVNYTAGEPIAFSPTLGIYNSSPTNPNGNPYYYSDSRNNYSHFGYLGFQSALLANLSFTAKAGFQYTDDYNDPLSSPSYNPYAAVSLIYTYLPGSYAQLGFNHQENATDVVAVNLDQNSGANFGQLTQAQESSSIYGSLNHQISPKLMATVIGMIQYSDYTTGPYTSNPDTDYSLGLNLGYSFTKHFSGEVGWNYDDLISGIDGRAYSRNRVYLGVSAAY